LRNTPIVRQASWLEEGSALKEQYAGMAMLMPLSKGISRQPRLFHETFQLLWRHGIVKKVSLRDRAMCRTKKRRLLGGFNALGNDANPPLNARNCSLTILMRDSVS
jgi:hypothetical protein